MPRPPPRDLHRSYNTRSQGIFKKIAELHRMDPLAEWDVVARRRGSPTQVFTTKDEGYSDLLQSYIETHDVVVKRPSHFLSLNEGIATGKAQFAAQTEIKGTLVPAASTPPRTTQTPPRTTQTPPPTFEAPVSSVEIVSTQQQIHPPIDHGFDDTSTIGDMAHASQFGAQTDVDFGPFSESIHFQNSDWGSATSSQMPQMSIPFRRQAARTMSHSPSRAPSRTPSRTPVPQIPDFGTLPSKRPSDNGSSPSKRPSLG